MGFNLFVMLQKRIALPSLLILVLLVWIAWYIYSGWGLVTLNYKNAPVSTVLASISRQGGIEIATNLDPATPVTIQVKRVPPVEALDIVAVRTDASWRLAYLGAPDRAQIEAALAAFRAGSNSKGWSSYGGGGFGGMIESPSGTAIDLRRAVWNPSAQSELHALFDDASRKTGVFLAAPAEWKPPATAPRPDRVADAIPALIKKAGGTSREVFLLRAQPQRDDEGDTPRGSRGGWIGGSPARATEGERGGGPRMDPSLLAERMETQIALLPEAEQPQARKDLEEMRSFWQQVRDLPEEERRAKAREFFSRPEMQERMEDRRLAREAKMTPQQRIDRAKRYFERKEAAKSQQNSNP